jgi:hypothetical protein
MIIVASTPCRHLHQSWDWVLTHHCSAVSNIPFLSWSVVLMNSFLHFRQVRASMILLRAFKHLKAGNWDVRDTLLWPLCLWRDYIAVRLIRFDGKPTIRFLFMKIQWGSRHERLIVIAFPTETRHHRIYYHLARFKLQSTQSTDRSLPWSHSDLLKLLTVPISCSTVDKRTTKKPRHLWMYCSSFITIELTVDLINWAYMSIS